MFTVPRRSHYVARWEIALFESDEGVLMYESQQELPGADVFHQQLRASVFEPDERAALYDDACRDISMCENLFALVLEDRTAVQVRLP